MNFALVNLLTFLHCVLPGNTLIIAFVTVGENEEISKIKINIYLFPNWSFCKLGFINILFLVF